MSVNKGLKQFLKGIQKKKTLWKWLLMKIRPKAIMQSKLSIK